MDLQTILAFVFAGGIYVWVSRRNKDLNPRCLPLAPGPKQKWLVGNLFDIPVQYMWLVFAGWSKKYGDIFCLQALGNTIIVLNTLESVNALLDKKGRIYSNRPEFTMAGELVGTDQSLPMLQYGRTWKNQRKIAHLALSAEAVKRYIPYQEDIARLYLQTLLEKPQDFMSDLRLASGRIVMAVTYGLPIQSYDDEYIAEAEAVLQFMERAVIPGAYLVDLIPAMKYLPNLFGVIPFQNEASKYRRLHDQMLSGPFEHVKRDLAAGKSSPSLTSELLTRDDLALDQGKEELIKLTVSAMYGAGGDTTFAGVLTFILAMVLCPDKQQKAQDEIDRVVGSERLPSIEDRSALPYVEALIKEVLRWHPVAPLGIAHRTSEADYHNNFYIPAGSLVMPNIWAMSRDETIYEFPEDFVPERFLKQGEVTHLDPEAYVFGFGRRVCPGRYLASNSMYILTTAILSTFRICKKVDARGNEIPVKPAFTGGIISRPEPFECQFIPRSSQVLGLIRNSRQ